MDRRIGLINLNQIMGLIKSNQDIQSRKIAICSIMIDEKTLNHDIHDTQSRLVHLGNIFEA